MMKFTDQYQNLLNFLKKLPSAAVAYSGGVDSALLLYAAAEALDGAAIGMLFDTPMLPRSDYMAALSFAETYNLPVRVIQCDPRTLPEVMGGTPDRCYHCKKQLFSLLRREAELLGISAVLDGQNTDDLSEHRPGRRAADELSVLHPLSECGFSKADIRAAARQRSLPVWDTPSNACLATRLPENTALTDERLHTVERGEALLRRYVQGRLRLRLSDPAVIETEPFESVKLSGEVLDEIEKICGKKVIIKERA